MHPSYKLAGRVFYNGKIYLGKKRSRKNNKIELMACTREVIWVSMDDVVFIDREGYGRFDNKLVKIAKPLPDGFDDNWGKDLFELI